MDNDCTCPKSRLSDVLAADVARLQELLIAAEDRLNLVAELAALATIPDT